MDPRRYFEGDHRFHFTWLPLSKSDAVKTLHHLSRQDQFDVYFNLCDGLTSSSTQLLLGDMK